MNRFPLFLLALAALALLLAACADDPAPAAAGDVRITCADVLNQGEASQCAAAPAASADAAPLAEYEGGTVARETAMFSAFLVENTGPTRNVVLLTYLDAECVPTGHPYPYSQGGVGNGPLVTGTTLMGQGVSCATAGTRHMHNVVYSDASYYYPGNGPENNTVNPLPTWVPGSDAANLLDYAVTVFTVQ